MNLTLKDLRRDLPSWRWIARRGYGFGSWEYDGAKDGRRVLVSAVSMLKGFSDEDSETSWFVEEGNRQSPYILFAMNEGRNGGA